MKKTDDQWKQQLTDEEYRVLRQKGTEAPFSGEFLDHSESGTYTCKACGTDLFMSDDKYPSGGINGGWPSFSDVASSEAVELHEDLSHGMVRTEVTCKTCGGHLGHVFGDGPTSSGEHYCINSVCLNFKPKE